MPSKNHGIAQANLIVEFAKHSQMRILSELALQFEGENFTPDISIYPRQPADFRHDVIRETDPPLTVVEIFSPKQGYQDVMDKVAAYFRSGVKSCWIVSPPMRTVTILLPDGNQQSYDSGIATDPATGLTANVDAVFS